MARDDFADTTKQLLGDQVGWKCSKPDCRASTKGPTADGTGVSYVGVAAHIHSASPGGARYDASQLSEERKAPENGIHLCQNHGKQVDDDEVHFTAATLLEWKARAVESAFEEIGKAALDQPLLQLRVVDPVGGANDMAMTGTIEVPGTAPQVVQSVTRARFYHLQVSNAHRTVPAHNVEIFLTRVDRRKPDGSFGPAWHADKARVVWRYEYESPQAPKARTIGRSEEVDLCYVVKDVFGRGPMLTLRPAFIPNNLAAHLQIRPNEPTLLYFQASGDESDSEVYRVRVWWDGTWSDDDAEMARRLTLELLP